MAKRFRLRLTLSLRSGAPIGIETPIDTEILIGTEALKELEVLIELKFFIEIEIHVGWAARWHRGRHPD